jgi:hypothetical protein
MANISESPSKLEVPPKLESALAIFKQEFEPVLKDEFYNLRRALEQPEEWFVNPANPNCFHGIYKQPGCGEFNKHVKVELSTDEDGKSTIKRVEMRGLKDEPYASISKNYDGPTELISVLYVPVPETGDIAFKGTSTHVRDMPENERHNFYSSDIWYY